MKTKKRQEREALRRPLLGWDYAHRGLHDAAGGIPENSLAAFSRAAGMGLGMELDVRLTADRHLVILHDDNLKRMCGIDQKVSEMNLSDLRSLHLLDTDEKIPLLSEVLKLVNGKVPLIIELKEAPGDYRTLCSLVWKQLSRYPGTYCVESFQPQIVRWFYRQHPEVVRGQLACRPPKHEQINRVLFVLAAYLLTAFYTHPDFIAYRRRDTIRPIFWFHKHLQHVMTALWTISSRREYEHYRGRADMMIFENFIP